MPFKWLGFQTVSDEEHVAIRPIREALSIWLMMAVIAAASFGWIYQRSLALQQQTIDQELTWLASTAASLIDGEKHKLITQPEQTDGDLYKSLIAPLVGYHRAAPSLYYVYTVTLIDSKAYFVLDTAKYVRDLRPTVALSPSRVMDVYEEPDPAMVRALEKGMITVGELYTDEFGTFKSAYAPFYDANKEPAGAVGVDLSAQEYMARIDEVFMVCLYGLLISVALATLIALLIYKVRSNTLKRELQYDIERREKERLLAEKNRENERLLANILPHAIALRLKGGEGLIADAHERVTVVFVDLAGFTRYSAGQPARRVVDTLNRIFTMMDNLTVKYNLEKIKTIGDSYMVVGGLDPLDDEHLSRVAEMTLEMIAEFETIKKALNAPEFNIRVGVATGPVVAGVIGSVKFVYDLWGDTVNTASRMESHSQPGKIQCNE
ncbi:MAG: adenylate/guanylate cyclase domain-containing protein, partial [Campylobacterales bacterium]